MGVVRIGIVGVGSRGLTVLERIVAHERQHQSGELEVFLFDPDPPGAGCHDPRQSSVHLVNTVAGQLTQFCDASVVGAGPVMSGPTFFQWLQEQARMGLEPSLSGAEISPDAYYPRGLFGRYLMWAFRYVRALAPPHLHIHFKPTEVEHARREPKGHWALKAGHEEVHVDHLFLTTGHTKPMSSRARLPVAAAAGPRGTLVVDDPYPMAAKLAGVSAGMTVAVEGMGLTAFDVVADLTVGRGGRFVTDPDSRRKAYVRSGHEPRLLLFSRSGLPLSARAVNQKGVSGQYRAHFLQLAKVREWAAQRKLDFVEDVLPLLAADMEYAWCDAYLREHQGEAAALRFGEQFAAAADAHQRRELVARHIPLEDRFSWGALAQPVPAHALGGREAYERWFIEHLRHDVNEARKGNRGSALKAACDVLRDLRDNLRAAIEFGGLTEASHRWVLAEFLPVMNRLAVGPPESRISEMLALIEAGVLEAGYGPGAACEASAPDRRRRIRARHWEAASPPVDVLVKARISMHSPAEDASPLLQGLLADGHVRLFHNEGFHPGGIDIDRQHHWIARDGSVIENAWALGIPTEGSKFCTFVIPRPGVNSTALVDAGRAVGRMLSMVRGGQAASPCGPPEALPSEEEAFATASLFGAL
ncbi:FAD/NAD(P)-binding protein [Ideonella sp. YS5]|uniref:FAD/NAD(P)-binding protein n=1 Tax=Ideonella sp. YS5 TaxID=3453714 RepID=UPI003EEE7878